MAVRAVYYGCCALSPWRGSSRCSLFLRARVPLEASAHSDRHHRVFARHIPQSFSPALLMWLLGLAGIGCCVAMSMPQVHIRGLLRVDSGLRPAVGGRDAVADADGRRCLALNFSGMLADKLGG